MAKDKSSNGTGRLSVLKTYKLYIGGKFPRTESGRFYSPEIGGKPLGNICLASRKDVRNAIVAARSAQVGWAGMTAFLRSQIVYRIGEMLESRRDQFLAELKQQGLSASAAAAEVDATIDRLVYYAGWCDKYQQSFQLRESGGVSALQFFYSRTDRNGLHRRAAQEPVARDWCR